MIAGRSLLNYTNLFTPNDYRNNVKMIYISISKTNMTEEHKILDFKLNEERNYFSNEKE